MSIIFDVKRKISFLAMSGCTMGTFFLPIGVANAASHSTTWKGEISFDQAVYRCEDQGINEIVVSGHVHLMSPEDADPYNKNIKTLSVKCPNLTFTEGSKITSISALDIRITGTTSGPVFIENTRGLMGQGKDAPLTPDIWNDRKMTNGKMGGTGGAGGNASGCVAGDVAASDGKPGAPGEGGADGKTYTAPKGANGLPGAAAGAIVLISKQYAEGTTIQILAQGGNGGHAGQGGRGADGGDGGKGGTGGRGGSANRCHSAKRGGMGGPGGDGGDGGNGGPGGDGGRGGNGGKVTVLTSESGGFLPTALVTNEGGLGGDPGLGGERGEGGQGGEGGDGGNGGDGKSGIAGTKIDRKNPGSWGNAGAPGKPGKPGKPGPLGVPGADGDPGGRGGEWTAALPEDQFNLLLQPSN